MQADKILKLDNLVGQTQSSDGALRCVGTSRGEVIGRARGIQHERDWTGRKERYLNLQQHGPRLDADLPSYQGPAAQDRRHAGARCLPVAGIRLAGGAVT